MELDDGGFVRVRVDEQKSHESAAPVERVSNLLECSQAKGMMTATWTGGWSLSY